MFWRWRFFCSLNTFSIFFRRLHSCVTMPHLGLFSVDLDPLTFPEPLSDSPDWTLAGKASSSAAFLQTCRAQRMLHADRPRRNMHGFTPFSYKYWTLWLGLKLQLPFIISALIHASIHVRPACHRLFVRPWQTTVIQCDRTRSPGRHVEFGASCIHITSLPPDMSL